MSRAIIIYRVDKSDPSNLGVVYKLEGQSKGLRAAGYKVDFIIHDDQNIYKNGEKISKADNSTYFKFRYYNYIPHDALAGYDLYLFRYGLATSSFVSCLRGLNQLHPESKIFIDMPTYPYAQEWKGIKGRLAMMIDTYYAKHLRKYVAGVLHSGNEEQILNMPTIRVTNGIDMQRVPLRSPRSHTGTALLAIGKWRSWHGLDRIIKGLPSYIEKASSDVRVHIVGGGDEVPHLKSLVHSLHLERYVVFHGVMYGDQLNRLFDEVDLGIGTLALHRKGVALDSSLKHREYIARGLPFIMAGEDVDLRPSLPFVIQVAADDHEIDLASLLKQFSVDDAYRMAQEMRSYAEDELSWQSKMKTFAKAIK